MNKLEYGIKRFFDYAVAGTGIVVTALPIAGIAGLMACVNKSDPFFRQPRVGKDGNIFQIYKIRTLKDLFDESGNPLPDSQRSTVIGCFLRKTRIDELPQFLNVLKGEMSLIGPRPGMACQEFTQNTIRQKVLPGILGASQVRIGRGHTEAKILCDIDYVKNQSLMIDLEIIADIPKSIIKRFKFEDFFKPSLN